MKFIKNFIVISVTALLVSACSSTQQAYLNNFKAFFASKDDVELTSDEIIKSPIDLIYVKNGERANATMALAFIEEGQYKWLSRDKAMFVTEKGRLVQTVGLDYNLIHITNLDSDPLKIGSGNYADQSWERYIDTEFGDFGAKLTSHFQSPKKESLKIQNTHFDTVLVSELVNYDSEIFGEHTWTNHFWYHSESKQLLKSIQKASAKNDTIELTYVSRALRLVKN